MALQALSYYGIPRVLDACRDAATDGKGNYRYLGIAASSDWIELGAGEGGYDLRGQLAGYAAVEKTGGGRYYCGPARSDPIAKAAEARGVHTLRLAPVNADGFYVPEDSDPEEFMTACQALEAWEKTKVVPLCQWQVHLFIWECDE